MLIVQSGIHACDLDSYCTNDIAHRLFSPNARRAGIFLVRPLAITMASIADVAAQRENLRSVRRVAVANLPSDGISHVLVSQLDGRWPTNRLALG